MAGLNSTLQVRLDSDQYAELDRLAAWLGVPVSVVARWAIRDYLESHPPSKRTAARRRQALRR